MNEPHQTDTPNDAPAQPHIDIPTHNIQEIANPGLTQIAWLALIRPLQLHSNPLDADFTSNLKPRGPGLGG